MAKLQRYKFEPAESAALELGKKPPQAIDMEEAVLGALMIEKDAIVDIQGLLVPESFYLETHQKIYKSIVDLSLRHDAIDIYTVAAELKRTDNLEFIGGAYYLSQLSGKIGSAAHIEYHAKIVAQKYIQRKLIEIASEIQRESFDDKIDVNELLDSAQQKVFEIAERNMRNEAQPISNIIEKTIAEMEIASARGDGFSGVPSGFTSLDRLTFGWQPSDLIIVAARPAMGKTAFVLSMARSIAVDFNKAVVFFSLEMPAIQLVKRLMISETGISSEKIKTGKLEDHEWYQLESKIQALSEAPLYIDDTPALSIFEFRSKTRRLVQNHKIELIIIDYLQLMTGPPETTNMREQEVSAISRSLKAIAKELNVPIIALSQLNRAVEMRAGNKRPQLSDLRESGAIEQDADIVAFIHRPECYGFTEDENGSSLIGIAEIILAKHRNGTVGDVKLRFRKEEARFYDFENYAEIIPLPQSSSAHTIGSKMNDDFSTDSAPDDNFIKDSPEFGDIYSDVPSF
ncbi:MAG: replicative DNA helicase [Prevotellaceae bacterium]|jgi:replicative DNA helicase|nr:replicative DNA helicase [Prevotellaceae bacterium]